MDPGPKGSPCSCAADVCSGEKQKKKKQQKEAEQKQKQQDSVKQSKSSSEDARASESESDETGESSEDPTSLEEDLDDLDSSSDDEIDDDDDAWLWSTGGGGDDWNNNNIGNSYNTGGYDMIPRSQQQLPVQQIYPGGSNNNTVGPSISISTVVNYGGNGGSGGSGGSGVQNSGGNNGGLDDLALLKDFADQIAAELLGEDNDDEDYERRRLESTERDLASNIAINTAVNYNYPGQQKNLLGGASNGASSGNTDDGALSFLADFIQQLMKALSMDDYYGEEDDDEYIVGRRRQTAARVDGTLSKQNEADG